ncbi:DUF1295 domain-containing protein [Pelagicoccus sp. SDUM812002]|uniref:DUF1295 domain-containing protein n=1 Tax=Pelagicoccus sp. SDUM812002 TaxID=3041266 RepID=UPI00280FFC7F|nr:DUF1295 domain-containing protein [Pelagicoccus sp. SDUM812002]MDQ8183977.1 DUF1295 domain-containing protein [Pelagicoccus sp. SDUM812002]
MPNAFATDLPRGQRLQFTLRIVSSRNSLMNKEEKKSLLGIPLILIVGLGFAFVGSNGALLRADGNLHPFALSVAIAFLLQWLAFVPAFIFQTERYFDLVGSLSYITVALLAYLNTDSHGARSTILLAMVLLWAARLGWFLFSRIHKTGKDGRFDEMKPSFIRFGAAWTLQGLWITFTAAAALAAIASQKSLGADGFVVVGGLVWLAGYLLEAVADWQKSRFKSDSSNKGKFIRSGLWSRSRHPNYFGEIVIWTGVAIIACPALEGWELVTLLSPVFVSILLCKVSGIPLLEERSDKKWGGQDDYEEYKRNTPVLIPKLW